MANGCGVFHHRRDPKFADAEVGRYLHGVTQAMVRLEGFLDAGAAALMQLDRGRSAAGARRRGRGPAPRSCRVSSRCADRYPARDVGLAARAGQRVGDDLRPCRRRQHHGHRSSERRRCVAVDLPARRRRARHRQVPEARTHCRPGQIARNASRTVDCRGDQHHQDHTRTRAHCSQAPASVGDADRPPVDLPPGASSMAGCCGLARFAATSDEAVGDIEA